jgi:hypothetical protein
MEGIIGDFKFKLLSEFVIAVYDKDDNEEDVPVSTIRIEDGVQSEREFHFEIMDWFSKNT